MAASRISPISEITPEPGPDCPLCPRLHAFRHIQRTEHPDWFNAPVPVFGGPSARLLIVGLAPGLKGANRTGRPFTGDFAGELLYNTLLEFGFAEGMYRADPGDGFALRDCMIANAVRCVPPENKPLPSEIKTCNIFLRGRIDALPRLKVICVLGRIAHDATLRAMDERLAPYKFAHGARHTVESLALFDSYHCSRYNTNTRVLTTDMFRNVFRDIRTLLDSQV